MPLAPADFPAEGARVLIDADACPVKEEVQKVCFRLKTPMLFAAATYMRLPDHPLIAFVAAGAAPIPRIAAHKVSLKRYQKHPKWAFRDPNTNALEPVYSVHYNDYAARLQGAQAAYDVGVQRTCWQIHSLTHWMGDAGRLKEANSQYRAHVYLSDVVRLGGVITAKEIDADGDHVVHVETRAMNQRGQNCMPGTAIVALPSRGAA